VQLVWSSTRIVWDQQILLLWILLTPVFIGSLILAFAAPLFFRDRAVQDAGNDIAANQPGAIAETAEQEAA
jgi:hypothetical protein